MLQGQDDTFNVKISMRSSYLSTIKRLLLFVFICKRFLKNVEKTVFRHYLIHVIKCRLITQLTTN